MFDTSIPPALSIGLGLAFRFNVKGMRIRLGAGPKDPPVVTTEAGRLVRHSCPSSECVCVCMYVLYVCMHACMYVCIYVYNMCVHLSSSICMCICIYLFIYVLTRLRT